VTKRGRKLTGLIRWVSELNPTLLKWGMAMLALVAVIGPILLVVGSLATMIATLIALFSAPAIGVFIAALTPLLPLIIAIGAAVLTVVSFFAMLAAHWDTLAKPWEDFGIFLKAIGIMFGDALLNLGKWIAAIARFIMPKWLERLIGLSPAAGAGLVESGVAGELGAKAAAGAVLGAAGTQTNNAQVDVRFQNAPPGTRTEIVEGENVTTELLAGALPATAQ
jgi:hypothetical protein